MLYADKVKSWSAILSEKSIDLVFGRNLRKKFFMEARINQKAGNQKFGFKGFP
jgi:hypothetical protein